MPIKRKGSMMLRRHFGSEISTLARCFNAYFNYNFSKEQWDFLDKGKDAKEDLEICADFYSQRQLLPKIQSLSVHDCEVLTEMINIHTKNRHTVSPV